MRITLLAVGSRGDVEPFVVLGVRLRRAGHGVRFATHDEFASTVGAAGLEFATLPGNPRAVLASPEGKRMLATRNPVALTRRMAAIVGPALDEAYPAAVDACRDADLVVYATLAAIGPNVADLYGVPAVAAHLQPQTPTRAFGPTGSPGVRDVPAALRHATWALADRLLWKAFLPTIAAQRRAQGSPPLPPGPPSHWPPGTRPPTLYGFSRVVVPVPPDWPPDVHVTGYWMAPPDPHHVPPRELAAFLDAGPAPVYIGFGSMPDRDAGQLVDIALAAARRARTRMVLAAGWAGLAPGHPSDDVLVVGDVPHRWLFERVAAVVHHGGAGTTAAGLRAGRPSVVVPFFSDQFFWGRRVAALGAGPPPIAREKLTAAALTEALRAALQPGPAAAAAAVGARIADEDGPACAVAVLERIGGRA
ncbi:Sterol 3-beta-glucosyltransferase [Pseudonocardia dioxanivorans CB1190]|jgi:UDP:flavonoid glycosyltransferase YjiC (YdhE family)|uniref:Sterol 3-beta-glucosyltransferase n=1 Tax=Pseudonocardia dioxanivorans (strain ATCC 55486 / DSM 44775 / JCM 13855 / CB1190) TaxID=675635 RepID=F4CVJ9_PSEUX|nr:glycosyltransferase [Pseudonocardia dioxanivorans]AEA24174.1 Sterol 3-beta-glucosyltransferase [Pseudonocardia dioxanivorans CB1190]